MLAVANRLGDASSFREVTRRGRRAAGRSLVVHLLTDGAAARPGDPPRVGLVVSRAVGNSVTRNRVKRRLRHLLRDRLDLVPPGARLVVRALPASAEASSSDLALDLDRALGRCLGHAGQAPGRASAQTDGRPVS